MPPGANHQPDRGTETPLTRALTWLLLLAGSLIFLPHWMLYAGTDTHGIAVVAQNIIDHGTLTLGAREADYFIDLTGRHGYRVFDHNGAWEYYFPLGPVLFVLPLVALTRAAGIDALAATHDAQILAVYVFASILGFFAITASLLRPVYGRLPAALIAILALYGTLIGPTLCGAFWTLNGEILAAGTCLLLLRPPPSAARGGAIGLLLFAGFLCRPTFAAFIAPMLILLALSANGAPGRARAAAAWFSAGAALIAYVLFCRAHYGTLLPPYYLGRLTGQQPLQALHGLLLSPSRSVLIYSPILLLLPAALARLLRDPASRPLALMLTASITLFFAANLSFPLWWASLSFGPRIAATACALGIWAVLLAAGQGGWPGRAAALGLLALGLYVNIPGITVPATRDWSDTPHVDQVPQQVFDWRFPQFLARGPADLRAKCEAYMPLLPPGARSPCP